MEYCCTRGIDSVCTTQNEVLNFLSVFFAGNSVGFSAMNTARAAVSAITIPIDGHGQPPGSMPEVRRMMRGVFNIKPSLPRYTQTWDVKLLLDHLRNFRLTSITMKDLVSKLATMFMLFSGQRLATIQSVCVKDIIINDHGCIVVLNLLQKTSKPGKHLSSVKFEEYKEEESLCIVSHIENYLQLSDSLRPQDCEKLFISFIKPHKTVSIDTLRRWVKGFMKDAGINTETYGAHSIRGAGASAVIDSGVPLDEVMSSVGWTSEKTLAKHYQRPIVKPSYGARIQSLINE